MISLLPITRLVVWVAVGYAAILILLVPTFTHTTHLSAHMVFAGASTLYFILMTLTSVGWKYVWRLVPALNQWLFPFIEGKWSMTIHWQREGVDGRVTAEAIIKQSLLKISMEVASEGSDSETLVAHPKKDAESGRPLLYYVYRVTPRRTTGQSGQDYLGSAILKFHSLDRSAQLRGNYFTSAGTQGHFELSRLPS